MDKRKKVAFTMVMGGLTSVAATGCVWQYRRYKESVQRWGIINESIDNFDPLLIEQIPW